MYIEASDIAYLAGWKTEVITRLWKQNGIAMNRAGRTVTTPDQLLGLFPEQLQAVMDAIEKLRKSHKNRR